jgi:hypothetical protein
VITCGEFGGEGPNQRFDTHKGTSCKGFVAKIRLFLSVPRSGLSTTGLDWEEFGPVGAFPTLTVTISHLWPVLG